MTTCFMLLIVLNGLVAQDTEQRIQKWRSELQEANGPEKLRLYHLLIDAKMVDDPAMALRDALRAEALAESILTEESDLISKEDLSLKPKTYLLLGEAFEARNRSQEALVAYTNAIASAAELEEEEMLAEAEDKLGMMASEEGARKKNRVGKAIGGLFSKTEGGIKDLGLETAIRMAKYQEKKENYPAAIKHYNKAIDRLLDRGDVTEAEALRSKVAVLQPLSESPPNTPVPPTPPTEDILIIADIEDSLDMLEIDQQLSKIIAELQLENQPRSEDEDEAVKNVAVRAVVLDQAVKDVEEIANIAREAEKSQDYAASLDYYKQFLALEQELASELRKQDSSMAEIKLLKNTNALQSKLSEQELDRQRQAKRNMAGGLGLAAALASSLLVLYRNKNRDHRKLGIAFKDLETTQKELTASQDRVKQLLKQHVSGAVADELLTAQGVQEVSRKFVCIMFLDIRDFTPFAEMHNPEEIIDYQNKVFGFMIDVINHHGGIVNQILGDGFMATFGAPVSSGNDCANAYRAARKILTIVAEKSESGEIPPTRVGIGLHAGNVVAGNVGTDQRKQYSITGNAVIIASRLEQLNKDFGSNLVLSRDVYDIIPEDLREPLDFQTVAVKGMSEPIEIAHC